MDGRSRAYIEVLLLLAAWRAAQDAESQLAHWLLEIPEDVAKDGWVQSAVDCAVCCI